MANPDRVQGIRNLKELLLKKGVTVAELEEKIPKQDPQLQQIAQEAISAFDGNRQVAVFATLVELLGVLEDSADLVSTLSSLSSSLADGNS